MLQQLAAPNGVLSGRVVVASAGTKVQLGAGTCKSVTIKALKSNAGTIYVGGASVSSANGFELPQRENVSLDISSLAVIYIDASVNGDGVTYIAIS